MNAYDKIYLDDAIHNFGVMIDYAVNTVECPAEQFWNRFLVSSIAERFSRGAVDIIAGHSGIELAIMVFEETGKNLSKIETAISISSKEYWAGITLARYQWKTGLSFKEITARGLGLMQTIAMFNPMHEADQSNFDTLADKIIEIKNNSWLKTIRNINGITQEQLSKKSEIPIRQIRAYEQEKIKIANAEYDTIKKLKTALNYIY